MTGFTIEQHMVSVRGHFAGKFLRKHCLLASYILCLCEHPIIMVNGGEG